MTRPVLLDWETRSHADLKTRGGPAYVAHETTEVLCGAAILPDGREFVWSTWPFTPPAGPPRAPAPPASVGSPYPPQEVLAACAASGVAAHNAEGFDRLVWEALGLPPVRWVDTAPRARRRGLPGSLEGACQAALGVGKDKAGSKVMLKLSVPQKGRLLAPVPLLLSAVVRYCLQDVRVMARLCDAERLFEPHVDDPALDLDTLVNRRGIELDVEWVEGILRELRAQRLEALDRARAALAGAGWEAPQVDGDPVLTFLRSPSQLLPFLRRHGAQVGDVQASTMRDLLAHPSPVVAALADARLAVARVTAGKLQRMLDHATGSPPRLTHLFAYHSAHTGRWGGRGPQPQNLPGLAPSLAEATPWTARAAAAATGIPLAAVLGGLVKKSLVPGAGRVFVMLDLASVEARGVLWLAGDQEGLDRFRAGDPYKAMAARLWSIPQEEVTKAQRFVGKGVTLGCGFAGGAPALLRGLAKGGLTEEQLRAAGVDPEAAVETWRDAHPLVAGERTGGMFEKRGGVMAPARRGGLWKALLRRARACVEEGRPGRTHGIRFDREGDHMIVTLPSGRPLVYRNVSMVDRVPPWGGPPKATICWRSPRGPKFMSPSVLVENCWAGDTLVLTGRGAAPISSVTADDVVWDGEEWVATLGAVSRGPREVVEWLGTHVTPEHKILAGGAWVAVAATDASTLRGCLSTGLASGHGWLRAMRRGGPSFGATAGGAPGSRSPIFNRGLTALLAPAAVACLAQRRKFYGTRACGTCGSTDTRAWSLAAPIQGTGPGPTTGGGGSGSTLSGSPTGTPSSATPPRSPGGTSSGSTWIGSTTTGGMSRGTCDWCRGVSPRPTVAELPGSSGGESGCPARSFCAEPVLGGTTTPSCTTSPGGGPPTGSRTTTLEREVWDLLNCGPRQRYTVWTPFGCVVAHNCVQALCRDLFVHGLLVAEAHGLEVTVHVHDGVAFSVPEGEAEEAFALATQCMQHLPAWAEGFPLVAEGGVVRRFE